MSLQTINEGIHYELIPSSDAEIDQAWDVRILEGPFVETVLRFGNIRFNAEDDCLNFNFIVISSPSGATTEDTELQEFAGGILESILEKAAQEGSLVLGEPKDNDED